jgi:hypothetical protein
MADLKIKPTAGTGNKIIIETQDGTDVITTGNQDLKLENVSTDSTGAGLGVQCAQTFQLTSNKGNVTTASDITADISEISNTATASYGSLVSQSSGIFSFSKTGIYWIWMHGNTSYDNDAEYNIQMIKTTVDNGTYVIAQKSVVSRPLETGSEGYQNIVTQCFFDVTNTTNCKVKFTVQATVNTNWLGSASMDSQPCTFQFIRLSDT